MKNKRAINELKRLYKVLEAGELAYAVSAVNIKNRGLKILVKSYAQQRATFKAEISSEIQRLGGDPKTKKSLIGALHRGYISLIVAITLNKDKREKVVLKEILIGEKYALHAYIRALKAELSAEVLALLTRQQAETEIVVMQVAQMHGKGGRRVIVRLFESEKDADMAELQMKIAGLHPDVFLRIDMRDAIDVYHGHTTSVAETMISGGIGGAFWGGLFGVLTGIWMQTTGVAPFGMEAVQGLWAYLTFAGILAGEFMGSMFGFAISVGMPEDDSYQYEMSLKRGKLLLMTKVDTMLAPKAGQIMAHVNIQSRDRVEKAAA